MTFFFKINRVFSFLLLFPLILFADNHSEEHIDNPKEIVGIYNFLHPDKKVVYLNLVELYENHTLGQWSYQDIKNDILENGKMYLIDTQGVGQHPESKEIKNLQLSLFPLLIEETLVLLSHYKKEILFFDISKNEKHLSDVFDETYELDDRAETFLLPQAEALSSDSPSDAMTPSFTGDTKKIPQFSFYKRAYKKITPEECSFRAIYNKFDLQNPDRKIPFCSPNGNISLIYKISWMRSVQYDHVDSDIPDGKIVRISIDDSVSGAGIHLNEQLTTHTSVNPETPWGMGYYREWRTSAVADNYHFTVKVFDHKAQILSTFPRSNLPREFEKKEISVSKIGVNAGTEIGQDGAKLKIEPGYSVEDTRYLTYKNDEYEVIKSNFDSNQVSFRWQSTLAYDDLLTESWVFSINSRYIRDIPPLDLSKISSIAYINFVPKFDVIYIADSKTTGTTHFQINSSVEINPLYHESDLYWLAFNYWEIRVKRNNKTVSVPVDFIVNWEHPIFIGARTVNLQLGSANNLCLSYDKDNRVSAQPCDLKNIQQAFVYDALGRYVAAKNMTLCLDAENLTRLEECHSNLSQRWYWDKENRSILKNEWENKTLFHKKTGELAFKPGDEANQDEVNDYSHKMLSAYMQL